MNTVGESTIADAFVFRDLPPTLGAFLPNLRSSLQTGNSADGCRSCDAELNRLTAKIERATSGQISCFTSAQRRPPHTDYPFGARFVASPSN